MNQEMKIKIDKIAFYITDAEPNQLVEIIDRLK